MKNNCLLLFLLSTIMVSYGQIKTSGTVLLGTAMSIKIDMDQSTSMVTFTATGPENVWFAIALNASVMGSNQDCINFGTTTLDQHFQGGHNKPLPDAINNLTQQSNTVSNGVRTVVVTRNLDTGDTNDYAFSYTQPSLNIVWALGANMDATVFHADFGVETLQFSNLAISNFTALDAINIYPNPSKNGFFNISENNLDTISKIKVFDNIGKLLKTLNFSKSNPIEKINLSVLPKGIYFIEISNSSETIFKKSVIE
jgi:hypothetical protein